MSKTVASWPKLHVVVTMGVAFLHLSVEMNTVPSWYQSLPVVWHPDYRAQTESHPHFPSGVIIVE